MTQGQKMLREINAVNLDLVRNPLGRHHEASDWLEDGDGTTYYLSTDGELYVEADGGREYVGALDGDALARLK